MALLSEPGYAPVCTIASWHNLVQPPNPPVNLSRQKRGSFRQNYWLSRQFAKLTRIWFR